MRKAAYFCVVTISALLAMIYGQSVLVPLITAALLWFITHSIKKSLNRLPFFDKYLPNWLKNGVVFALMIVVLTIVIELLISNITALVTAANSYGNHVAGLIEPINDLFHIDADKRIQDVIDGVDFNAVFAMVINGLTGFFGNFVMILIYALFIFLEEASIKQKIANVFDHPEQRSRFLTTLSEIESSLSAYLRLKTVVSLLTGAVSFLVLWLVGIQSPIFWAFLIFMLNYIPTIGSLVATVFPALFSLLQFGSWTPFFLILILVGAVQLIVGNIVEPRIMGKSLNVSPLVTILALASWGLIWGITGMILSVPFTVVLIIVFSHFEATRKLAMLLTETGRLANVPEPVGEVQPVHEPI